MEIKPSIFIEPEDAVRRLSKLYESLKKQIKAWPNQSEITSLTAYCIGLNTQAVALKYLNEFFEVGVPWDEDMGLPSSSSLAADVRIYAERMDFPGALKGLLLSFSGWSLFKREEIVCACGWHKDKNSGFGFRTINADVMINTAVIRTTDGKLKFKQLLGIKADDADHLAHHYEEFSRQSSAVGDLMIIMESENLLSLDREKVRIEKISLKKSKNFDIESFSSILFRLLDFQLAGNT